MVAPERREEMGTGLGRCVCVFWERVQGHVADPGALAGEGYVLALDPHQDRGAPEMTGYLARRGIHEEHDPLLACGLAAIAEIERIDQALAVRPPTEVEGIECGFHRLGCRIVRRRVLGHN